MSRPHSIDSCEINKIQSDISFGTGYRFKNYIFVERSQHANKRETLSNLLYRFSLNEWI